MKFAWYTDSMSDGNHIVSKVGQRLIEHVMKAVIGECESEELSEDAYLALLLERAYEAVSLAVGWVEVAARVSGIEESKRKATFLRHYRMGQALALDKYEAEASENSQLHALIETLQPELSRLRKARADRNEAFH